MQSKLLRNVWVLSTVSAVAFGASLAQAKPPACPPGQRPGISGCRSGTPQVRSATPPSGAAAAKQGGEAAAPAEERPKVPPAPDSSLRPPNSLERADRRLLLQEIASLERLVKATHPKSPDRPMLLLRLAGAYSELRSASERDYTRLEIQIEEMKRIERTRPPTNKQLSPETPGPSRHLTL